MSDRASEPTRFQLWVRRDHVPVHQRGCRDARLEQSLDDLVAVLVRERLGQTSFNLVLGRAPPRLGPVAIVVRPVRSPHRRDEGLPLLVGRDGEGDMLLLVSGLRGRGTRL